MMQQNRVSYIERRRFLCGMVSGGAAALGTVVAVPTVAYIGNRHVEPVPDFVVLSAADYDVAPGSSRIVRYGPRPLLILRTPEPNSTLKIFQATCTHLDCIVSYEREAGEIVCACHGGRFSLEGQVLAGPPPSPLGVCHHALRGDQLVVALEPQNLKKGLGANGD